MAVTTFGDRHSGEDPPLRKAMADMIITDLPAFLDPGGGTGENADASRQLKLGKSGVVDSKTAPRVGRSWARKGRHGNMAA